MDWSGDRPSRAAYLTGYPAVLGWQFQEATWRGPEFAPGRYEDVQSVFLDASPFDDRDPLENLLRKYGVRYIWFGPLERHLYGSPTLLRFNSFPFLEAVFENDWVTVYEVSLPESPGPTSAGPAEAPEGP